MSQCRPCAVQLDFLYMQQLLELSVNCTPEVSSYKVRKYFDNL